MRYIAREKKLNIFTFYRDTTNDIENILFYQMKAKEINMYI